MGWQEEMAGQINKDKQELEKCLHTVETLWQKFLIANTRFLESIRLEHSIEYEKHHYLRGYNCKKDHCKISHCLSQIQVEMPEKIFYIAYDKKTEKLYGWDRNAFIGEFRYFIIDDNTPHTLIENVLRAKSDLTDGLQRWRFFSPGS